MVAPNANNAINMTQTATHMLSYSNYHALSEIKAVEGSDAIDAYIVTAVADEAEDGTRAVSLTKLDAGAVIPANTGVILMCKSTSTPFNNRKAVATVPNADNPWLQYNGTETNMLVATPEGGELQFEDEDGYNYILGYKKLHSTDAGVTWGFYKPGSGTRAANSCHLHIKKVAGKNAPAMIRIRMVADDSTVTGIDEMVVGAEAVDAAIYNLSGRRIAGDALPKGIYIQDGKKFVVK